MRYINFKIIYIMFFLSIFNGINSFSVQAEQQDDDLVAQMDSFLGDLYKPDAPGASVLVAKNGKTIFRKSYGMGNIELNIPLRPDMVFRIGSITKQFTAAAIMILEDQGKLKLSDSITKFLPDYPLQGYNITIENLMSHTSGIQSYTNSPDTMKKIEKEDLAIAELLDVFKDLPMDFEPSTAFSYSNSGFVVLGAIIEKASGKTYENFIQDEIFTPLGMTNSYYGNPAKIIPARVDGYRRTDDGYEHTSYISMHVPFAAGALLSTVDDLQKWNTALYSGKLISKKSLKKMTTPYMLTNGKNAGSDKKDMGFGYGLDISEIKGRRTFAHGGGINGFITHMQWIESEKLQVIVLTNIENSTVSPVSVSNQLAAIAIGDPFIEPKEIKVDASILKRYAGKYMMEEFGAPVDVRLKNGQLYIQVAGGPTSLVVPYSKTEFFVKNELARATFVTDSKGNATQVILIRGTNEIIAIRLD